VEWGLRKITLKFWGGGLYLKGKKYFPPKVPGGGFKTGPSKEFVFSFLIGPPPKTHFFFKRFLGSFWSLLPILSVFGFQKKKNRAVFPHNKTCNTTLKNWGGEITKNQNTPRPNGLAVWGGRAGQSSKTPAKKTVAGSIKPLNFFGGFGLFSFFPERAGKQKGGGTFF